jgi:hypothetical protein
MGHTLHHQGLNLDAELLHSEREHDREQEHERRQEQEQERGRPGGAP